MDYVSTRGSVDGTSFRSVILSGLAPDGGLYVPHRLPHFSCEEIANWSWLPFDELAYRVIAPFIGDAIDELTLQALLKECYQEFSHRAVAPLQQIGQNEWVLQLHYGPTQASKDFAAQLQSRLVACFLPSTDRAVVIGATNGDTGLAAIEAFKHHPNVQIIALYPKDGVPADRLSGLYESVSEHVHLIEIDGSFDDCQTMVSRVLKSWPSDGVTPISFNSTNWVGVLAQIVFFFYSALQLGGGGRPVGFSIPGASFAEIYACFIAQKMGLPVNQVIVSTNSNDSLHHFINENSYCTKKVSRSLSPSMDFSLFSNLERFIWELYDHNSSMVQLLMENFESSGKLSVGNKQWLEARMLFDSYAVGDDQVLEEILALYKTTGLIVNPQTATGALATRLYRRSLVSPMITLAQLAPEKSSILLTELGVWDGNIPLSAGPSTEHPILSVSEVEELLRYIRGL
jgi:threonine synthase